MLIIACISSICFAIVAVNGRCTINTNYRGQFQMLDKNTQRRIGQLTIRRDNIMVTNGRNRQNYRCFDGGQNDNYLFVTSNRNGVVCLSFSYIADATFEFSLRRESLSTYRMHLFGSTPRVTGATARNTCGHNNGPSVFLQRARPGCNFPTFLRKTWWFGRRYIKSLTFYRNKLTVQFQDDTTLECTCERIENEGQGYNIAMRINAVNSKRDGVLCLYLRLNPGYRDQPTTVTIKKLNTGTDIHNLVKLTYRYGPIYLHQTCDLVDTPVDLGYLS